MDDNGRRENGRHKPPQGQWFMHHQPSMKQIMAVMAERDAAIQERNLAISEKKAALVERDMGIMQRDSAISERNNAIIERDKAIAMNKGNMPPCPPGPTKRANEAKPAKPTKKGASKSSKKVKLENEGLNKTVFGKSREQKNGLPGPDMGPGLNETNMAGPVCSCTGVLRPCYKWGNGGWQSSCCTMNLSMYPLPAVPNKRHARVGGRKMSGSAFSKLQNRLSSEGHDLSKPVDLKDHWAKHGTNRYITIK